MSGKKKIFDYFEVRVLRYLENLSKKIFFPDIKIYTPIESPNQIVEFGQKLRKWDYF